MKVASRIRSGAALVVAAVLSLVVLPGSAQASARPAPVVAPVLADAPFRLPQPITDNAGALNGDSSAVQTALTKLDNTGKAHLWVVFVKSFGTTNNADWAAQTFSLSSLDPKRDALLAVAVDDHSYYLGANSAFPLSASDLDAIGNNDVRPHLSSKDWAGAAVAAANGIQTKLTSSSSSGWVIWVILLVIIGVGVWFWMRSRRRKAAPDAPADSGVPAKPLEPYEQLSERSVQALIATDNTVRTSEAQLTLAEQTFGATAVADFRTAFEQARALLADAFALRQQIDDDVPESEQQRRDWMAQILDKCAAAHKTLDDQSDRFDQLLDVKTRLPQVLSELPGQIDAQVARIPTATSTLASLTQAYVASATGTVAGNTEQAQSRLDYARHELAEAGGTDGSQAVLAARAALEAVAQATMLLGSIDKLRDDLAAAAAALPGKLAPVQAELAAARAALSEHSAGTAGTSLTQRLDQVAAALAAVAGTAGAKDPILATQRVHEADEALDQILADTRSAQENEDKLGRALTNAMSSAGSKIERVSDYLSQRRGVVGSEARTRLAEASRHLAQAQALAGTDQAQALSEAHQADAMADEALRLAQNDFTGFGGGGYGGGYGGGMFGGGRGGSNIGGAILGGIIGGILSGGGGYRGGGFGGGFGGGGGGGFGGGSSGGGGDFGGGGGRF